MNKPLQQLIDEIKKTYHEAYDQFVNQNKIDNIFLN